MSFEEQRDLESRFVMGTFARKPVCLVEGKGMRVWDDKGRELLDFIAGIGVCSLGHCHPAVVGAVSDQASKLIHVSNYYYIEKRGELARMLSDLLDWGLSEQDRFVWRSFFSNSGAESNECAIKLARLYARRFGNGGTEIVTLERSFHGRTMETLAATAQPAKQEAFQPVPEGFVHTPINDLESMQALFDDPGHRICAVMLEPVQGESGVHPCTAEFLQGVARICRENGALLIADEVQTGIYRTGRPFGFQNFGVVPDIVTMAKGIASGFPMGACAAKEDVARAFQAGDHGSTFGGSNLAVAAALATLSALGEGDTAARVDAVGRYFRERLEELPGVCDVRGYGLMVGCDVVYSDAGAIVSDALEAGFLLNCTGPRTLRFLPPLICGREEVDAVVGYLAARIQADLP